jgi:hypothetical protein
VLDADMQRVVREQRLGYVASVCSTEDEVARRSLEIYGLTRSSAYARSMSDDSSNQHPEPVVVATYPDRGEAEVTRAHLVASGIEAFIVDEVEGGMLPVYGEAGVTVLVQAQDADRARQVLGSTDPS